MKLLTGKNALGFKCQSTVFADPDVSGWSAFFQRQCDRSVVLFCQENVTGQAVHGLSLTKAAIESFTKSLAFELGPHGVRVNAIAPGTATTPQVEENLERLDRDAKDRFSSMIRSIYPLQTIGEPEDIANIAVFPASDQAKWITGAIFAVDGGLTTIWRRPDHDGLC